MSESVLERNLQRRFDHTLTGSFCIRKCGGCRCCPRFDRVFPVHELSPGEVRRSRCDSQLQRTMDRFVEKRRNKQLDVIPHVTPRFEVLATRKRTSSISHCLRSRCLQRDASRRNTIADRRYRTKYPRVGGQASSWNTRYNQERVENACAHLAKG